MAKQTFEMFPLIDQKLIIALEKLFPDCCPDEDHTERRIWMDRGSVEVVRLLKRVKAYQDETVLARRISP